MVFIRIFLLTVSALEKNRRALTLCFLYTRLQQINGGFQCFLITHRSILGLTARARIRWLQMLRVVRSIEKNIIKKIKKMHAAARHPLVACWRMACGTLASLSNTQRLSQVDDFVDMR